MIDDGDVRILHGSALEQLRTLPDESVQCIITSPPFWALRDYGTGTWQGGDETCDHKAAAPSRDDDADVQRRKSEYQQGGRSTGQHGGWEGRAFRGDGKPECPKCGARRVDHQIGLEPTPDAWCAALVAVFRECRRVLRNDGCMFLEVGDTYAAQGGGKAEGQYEEKRVPGATWQPSRRPADGYKPKDLVGAPWLLAKALRDPYYTGTIRNEADRVWLAAILDGEGSIGIHCRPAGQRAYTRHTLKDGNEVEYYRKNASYQPKVEITNTSRALMDRVVAIAGGNCDTKQEAGTHGRKQTIYRWTVTADKARAFLAEVYPHLVAKQHEARLAYSCPSSGEKAAAAHEALKLIHQGSDTSVDLDAPPTLWEAGWFLRSDIIWARQPPNPMPESVTDRPTKAHSYVFLLTKSARYFYDADAIREEHAEPGRVQVNGGSRYTLNQDERAEIGKQNAPGDASGYNPAGRNARSVWSIPTEPTPFAHFATFPQALVERCIKAGTSEHGACGACGKPWKRVVEVERVATRPGLTSKFAGGDPRHGGAGSTFAQKPERHAKTTGWAPDCSCNQHTKPCVVLDPFMGSGTTALVARRLGRHAIGIELNADYIAIARKRLEQLSLFAPEIQT